MFRHGLSGEPAGGPGGLKIEPAGQPVNVEKFPAQMQSRTDPALHGFKIHLAQPDPAAGYKLILVQALAAHGKFRAPQLVSEFVLRSPRERRPSCLTRDA